MLEALMHLDSCVRVSEQGFDREDSELVGTPETIAHWHQLIQSVTRMFVASGLAHRSVQTLAALGGEREVTPRLPR